ncbi:Sec63 [Apophysomyces sp. BC1034]|nr:Sec63 [Apophysomyces sp. BC1021]KAG0193871.1 Sec63 [Apophysomyces sp. BC1034]
MDHQLRYVAVSATVPNLADVAEWIGGKALSFSEDYRPVKLERFIYGVPFRGDNMFLFEKTLDWKILNMIERHGDNKPVLIFCPTRKSTQSSCDALLKMLGKKNSTFFAGTETESINIQDKKLKEYVRKGVGFHHDLSDRRAVEQLFSDKKIQVIATTSTLAVGVNLPAHLVIIKSTKGYQNGKLAEYSDIDMLQMLGRAGRPGLDDSGCAVILTTVDMEHHYRALVSGSNNLESSLHKNLVEHLMSEICLGTITDVQSSTRWLQSTFLYVRVKKNPAYYQLPDSESPEQSPDIVLQDICMKGLNTLVENELVIKRVSETDHTNFEATVSHAPEYEFLRYSVGEKPFLNTLKSNANIRFPLNEKLTGVADKVFLMIQVRYLVGASHKP